MLQAIPFLSGVHHANQAKPNQAKPSQAILLSIVVSLLVSLTSCDDQNTNNIQKLNTTKQNLLQNNESIENSYIVYYKYFISDNDGNIVHSEEMGEINDWIVNQVAKSSDYMRKQSPWIYSDEAFSQSINEEWTENYYIVRAKYHKYENINHETTPKKIDPKLKQIKPSEEIFISLKIKKDDIIIPMVSPEEMVGPEEHEWSKFNREQKTLEAIEEFNTKKLNVIQLIESSGGQIFYEDWRDGWIHAKISGSILSELLTRDDIISIYKNEEQVESQCDATCNGNPNGNWELGTSRQNNRTGAQKFLDSNYNGEIANPSRHSYEDITVGVVEVDPIEARACAFMDAANCTNSRIKDRYDCRTGNCIMDTQNYPDGQAHATLVSSIIIGDYQDNQGNSQQLGDICWATGNQMDHCPTWEQSGSGMAPEASITFSMIGSSDPTSGLPYLCNATDCRTPAFNQAINDNVDIMNGFFSVSTNTCNISSQFADENTIENAYDDGIFPIFSAGNNFGLTSTTCNVDAPGDTPKAFRVNSLDANNCQNNYQQCHIGQLRRSALGGGDAIINGISYNGILTMNDLAAPQNLSALTRETGTLGIVGVQLSGGTSMSAPHVAGAAALVKHWLIDTNNLWINFPGRMHAVMLSMGDRTGYITSATPATCANNNNCTQGFTCQGNRCRQFFRGIVGADDYFGMGRLRLRLLKNKNNIGPWGFSIRTENFTSSSGSVSYLMSSSRIPVNSKLFKCVMHESEDMSSKTEISDIRLKVDLLTPNNNGICNLGEQVFASIHDNSRDIKNLVAFEDDIENIEDLCAKITIEKVHVTSQGTSAHVFCYYAGKTEVQDQ